MNKPFDHIVFELFREWTKGASFSYPKFNFEIIDETLLIDDVHNSFEKAIASLNAKSTLEKRKQLGYDYSYITSYVQSGLNVQWHQEYIEKQTQEYKKFVVFKTMEQFFRVDTITAERLTKLYYHMLYKDVNLMNFEEDVKHEIIINEEIELINVPKDNPVLQMINNQITDYVNEFLKTDKLNYMPDIRNYFTYCQIKENFKTYKAV